MSDQTFIANVKYKKLNEFAKLPTRGSEEAAGYDLYAAIPAPIIIPSGQNRKVGTGLAFEIPRYTFAGIFARSGAARDRGLRPANAVGKYQ